MYRSLKFVAALTLVAIVATTSFGQDADKKKKKKKDAPQPQAISALMKKVEGLGVTEDQTAKLKKIGAEFGPKFAELNKKLASVLTDEQKQARKDAAAKAKADGKKGKEARDAVNAALALTADQQKVQTEVQASLKELSGKLNEAVMGVLTPEQKEKLAPAKNPGKKGKKKAEADK